MELMRRLKILTVSTAILLAACFDSGVISAPVADNARVLTSENIGYNILCDACESIAKKVRELVKLGVSETIIVETAIELCNAFDIEDKYVCETIVPEFKDEVIAILTKTALSGDEICGTILGSSCGSSYDPFNQNWTIPIPGDKPPVKAKTPNLTAPVDRILHISDIHWDPQYTVGLTTQCGEPLCCRPPNAKADKAEDAAGLWGDAHCDVPYRTVINLMEHLKNTSDQFDWVYVTGDLPAHNDWTQTRDGQLSILSNITGLFKKYLPGKLVFFAIGNHESDPVNSFPPPYITGKNSESWLYDKAADQWADWLTPDAVNTLKYGGYFATNVRSDLKVISLETNFCNKGNWWLFINSTDPGNMLQWLNGELLDSEKKEQKVHIIGHIAPGSDDCNDPWTRMYTKIIDRFENTVVGQFFGHVHTDSFRVLYSDDKVPIGTVFLGPSVTTYTSLNPGYRIYDIEGSHNGSSRIALEHYTYVMNLTDANKNNSPQWKLEYTAKSTYNLTSLLATEWDGLVTRFTKDDGLFQKYYRYQSKSFSLDECTGACKCSKLKSLAYGKDIKCSDSTDEEIRKYKQMNELLC